VPVRLAPVLENKHRYNRSLGFHQNRVAGCPRLIRSLRRPHSLPP